MVIVWIRMTQSFDTTTDNFQTCFTQFVLQIYLQLKKGNYWFVYVGGF
jgi:hypothetical protein